MPLSNLTHTRQARRHPAVYFDLVHTADERFDRPIEWLLIALLVFAPLALGAVQRWSELVVYALCAAMVVLLAMKLVARRDVPFVWSWTYMPVAAMLLLTCLQLVPLPAGVVRFISPHTVELRESLLDPIGESRSILQSLPLSFYPEATLANLRLLLAEAGVYVVTLNVIRRADQIQRILSAVAMIGVVVALIALGHLISGAEKVYGLFGRTRDGWPVGPFINPNHLGQFLNLSIGAGLAVLLVRFEQVLREQRRGTNAQGSSMAHLPPAVWTKIGAVVLCVVATLLTLSRGAIIGMLVSMALAVVVSRRRGARYLAWVAGLIVLVVLFVLSSFDLFEPLTHRFREMTQDRAAPAAGRVQIISDILVAWRHFPVLGTGMGTFEVIYPMYDRSATSLLATHAENEYAQMLVEGGVLGLAVVLVFAGMIARKYGRCIRSAPSPMASAAVGLGFGLLAVMVQSLTDFGQHIPANAMLSSVFCALVVTLARASRQTSPADAPQPVKRRTWRVAGAIGAGVLCIVVLSQSWVRARAESLWAPAKQIEPQLRAGQWIGDVRVYRRLLDAAIEGSDRSPHDIHYRYWLNYYRWKYIRQSRDPGTGQLILSEQQIEWSRRIVHELLNGLRDCPTYGPSYSLAGQIAMNVLNDPRGPALIRTGWRLSQADPQANMEAGLLDAREGKWDDALKKLRHAADVDTAGAYLDEAVATLAHDLHRPDMALELADNNVQAVRRIVAILEADNELEAAAQVKQDLASLIKSLAEAPRASKTALQDAGQLAMEQRDFSAAVEYFRRALSFDLTDADLRLQLAQALAEAGQLKQALEEAETAGRLGSESARNFALELKLRPQTRPSSAPTH